MSGPRKAPQARDRMLGAQLRALRVETTDLTSEQAAELAHMSTATMSRLESGRRHVPIEDVATLLTIYKVPPAQRVPLLNAARDGTTAACWQAPLPGMAPDAVLLASHESWACAVVDWSTIALPSLLQTREYALAYLAASGASADDVASVWSARSRRQEVLPRIDYTAFIHDLALRTPLGGKDAFRDQVRHLCTASDRGIGVHLVRATARAASLSYPWTLLTFPTAPPLVRIELQRSAVFLHDQEAAHYLVWLDDLRQAACSVAESRTILTRLAEQL